MVKFSFNLSKRDLVWMGLIVVFAGLGFGYAYGGTSPAVEGHSVGEISFVGGFNVPSGNVGIGVPVPTQKLDVNGNVKANDFYITKTGKWASTLGGGGSLSCITRLTSGTIYVGGTSVSVSCPTGYTMTGGGMYGSNNQVDGTFPQGNGWRCNGASSRNCYVRCCKL